MGSDNKSVRGCVGVRGRGEGASAWAARHADQHTRLSPPHPTSTTARPPEGPDLALPNYEEVGGVAGGHKAVGVQHQPLVRPRLAGLQYQGGADTAA